MPTTEELFTKLLTTALHQDRRSGTSEVLREIAEAFDSQGCVLWCERLGGSRTEGTLFVLAQWVEEGSIWALHDLPIRESLTGEAILTRRVVVNNDLSHSKRAYLRRGLVLRSGFERLCSAPLSFTIDGKTLRGALNLFRKDRPFDDTDVQRIGGLASFAAPLLQSLRDRAALRLLHLLGERIQMLDMDKRVRCKPPNLPSSKSVNSSVKDLTHSRRLSSLRTLLRAPASSVFAPVRFESISASTCMRPPIRA